MVLATLPRLMGPSEKMEVPITVFAMENFVKEVEVQIESNEFIQLKKRNFKVTFNQTGDQVVNVPIEVAQKMGIATLKVTARSGKEVAYHEIEVDVRAPNPVLYEGGEYALQPGEEKSFPVSFFGISGSNKVSLEMSQILPIGLHKRLDYLIDYPHGCIEQTTSSVFPQLFLSQLMELESADKRRIESNVKEGIQRLVSFQTADGGFAYWPGNYVADEWGSNYAGHFLLTAEKMGYSVPSGMKNSWISYQKSVAQESDLLRGSQLTQAYRLFTLALCGEPELSAMNRMREQSGLTEKAKWRLATAYYLIGQKEVARDMVENLPYSNLKDDAYAHTYGSGVRDQGMILESLALMKDEVRGRKLVAELSKRLNSDYWYSTQTTAYTLLGISTYYGANSGENGPSFTAKVNGKNVERKTKEGARSNVKRVVFSEKEIHQKGTVTVKNTGTSKLFVKMVMEGIPMENKQPKQQNNLTMSLIYRDMDGKQIDPNQIKQGTDFVAEVTISNPGKKGDLQEIALSQLFPNGWEIHNARMYGGRSNGEIDYQDIRDDRIYSYFDLMSGKSITIKTQLNAAYLGEFYHPSVHVETMYNHLINASLPGRKVRVVE